MLDTNVLLSGIAYPGSLPGKIITPWRHGSVEVVLPTFIIEELRRVLPRLAARHGLSASEIDDLVDILSIQAEPLEPALVEDAALRDRNDLPVLGTLLAAMQAGNIDT
ncbi:MAG: PIN domain-containing protein [Thiobacillus sp.]